MTDTTSSEELLVSKKPVKEVPIYQDTDTFKHKTGDIYDGGFEIKKKDRSIKMNGTGTYFTAGGESYHGHWDRDKLTQNEMVSIIFPDGAKYEGIFKDWCYYGAGKYTYPDGTVLLANFVENCPVGGITLYDPNGHKWLGKAEVGYAWLGPVNHYYEMLDKTLDVHKKGLRSKTSLPSPPSTKKQKKVKALSKTPVT